MAQRQINKASASQSSLVGLTARLLNNSPTPAGTSHIIELQQSIVTVTQEQTSYIHTVVSLANKIDQNTELMWVLAVLSKNQRPNATSCLSIGKWRYDILVLVHVELQFLLLKGKYCSCHCCTEVVS